MNFLIEARHNKSPRFISTNKGGPRDTPTSVFCLRTCLHSQKSVFQEHATSLRSKRMCDIS